MKKHAVMVFRRMCALVLALSMVVLFSFAAYAAEANEAVKEASNGVIQVRVVYYDELGHKDQTLSVWGSGFLINDSTVVTSDHVVSLSSEELKTWAEMVGVDARTLQDRLRIEVVVMNDVTIQATILQNSAEMDFAILRLEQQIYDRHYLPIRNSDEVTATESVYALGFPGEVADTQVFNTFTSEDVTISAGTVSKMNEIENVDVVMTSAKITSGASGGPLIDTNGNVIGINMGSTGDGLSIGGTTVMLDNNYFYHVASSGLISALNALGIEYTNASESGAEVPASTGEVSESENDETEVSEAEPEPSADKTALASKIDEVNGLDLDSYSDESVAVLEDALDAAVTVNSNANATQSDVESAYQSLVAAQNALEAKGGIPILLIVIPAVVVVIIIAVVVILLLKMKKGSNKMPPVDPYRERIQNMPNTDGRPQNAGFQQVPPQPAPPQPVPSVPVQRPANETTVLNQGSNETTVLNQGSNETTVLNQSFGKLTRVRTNETVTINKTEFVVGRERSRVDYCISDNTNIGRAHAKILSRGGTSYLVDLNATNGTFLNSVKVSGTQVALKDGDKITLADENFTFNA